MTVKSFITFTPDWEGSLQCYNFKIRMEVADSDKRTSLLCYRIEYEDKNNSVNLELHLSLVGKYR